MAEGDLSIRQALDMPPEEMLRYLAQKDYRTTVNWAEMWQDDHVRSFTVAKVARRDLLETIRGSMHDALQRGVPMEQWRAQLIPELQKAGWWGLVQDKAVTGTDKPVMINPRRLDNIFVTNFRMAAAAAQWKTIQAAKGLLPYLRYRTRGDERVRHSHQRLNDIVLPVDHPFWLTHFPPNDWRCRCRVVQLSGRMLERRGLKVTPDKDVPEIAPRSFWQPGASAPEIVPGGVAPGFGYNPGVSYLRTFAPPPLSGPLPGPSVAARNPAGPLHPLPAPRQLPANVLLPRDIDDDTAIARFVDSFEAVSGRVDGELVFTDAGGEPLVISPQFFRYPDGTSKLTPDRRATVLLLAEAIQSPDEIWHQWEQVFTNRERTKWRWRLTRRYVARFEIEGQTRPAVAFLQVGKDGWYGATAFPTNARYIEQEQVRGGVLLWRRPRDEQEEG